LQLQHAESQHATPSAVCGHCEVRSCANPALNTSATARRRFLFLNLGDISA
jgi:alkaline phosphatase